MRKASATKSKALVWIDPPEQQVPWWGDFNDGDSTYDSVELIDPRLPVSGVARVDINDAALEEVARWDVIPTTAGARLVSPRLRNCLASLVAKEIAFLPAVCRFPDKAEIVGYHFSVPLLEVPCTDLERTEVTSWIIPGKRILSARKLRFHDGCIAPTAIARDSYTESLTIIGRDLASDLAQRGFTGLHFVTPESLPSLSGSV
jgi:hypothetical protein